MAVVNDEIYVTSLDELLVFPLTANGDVTPSRRISGFSFNEYLAIDNGAIGGKLIGAGGGGFAYFLCRDPDQADRLRGRLSEFSARPGFPGSVYTTQINRDGLVVKGKRVR